jgi:hypothetical protein
MARRLSTPGLGHAREIGHAASLMYTLGHGLFARYECGNYANATAAVDELIALAEKKGTLFWKGFGLMHQGCVCALNAQPSEAVRLIISGIDTRELTGATLWIPFFFSYLARAYVALGNFEDARRSIGEAMMTIKNQGNMVRSRSSPNRRRSHAAGPMSESRWCD